MSKAKTFKIDWEPKENYIYVCFIIWRGKKKRPLTNSPGSDSSASSLPSASSTDPWIFSPPIQEPGTLEFLLLLKGSLPVGCLENFPSGDQGLWFWGIAMRPLPNAMLPEASVSCRAQPCWVWLLSPSLVTGLHHQQLHQEDAEVLHFQIGGVILWSYYAERTLNISNVNSESVCLDWLKMDENLVFLSRKFLGENNADFNVNPIRSGITLCLKLSNPTVIFHWRRSGCEYFSIQILVLPSASCISYVQTIANRASVCLNERSKVAGNTGAQFYIFWHWLWMCKWINAPSQPTSALRFCEMHSETESSCLPHQIEPSLLAMINFTSDHWNIHAEFSRLIDPITWCERTSQRLGPVPLWFAAAWLRQLSMLLPDVAVLPLSALLVHSASPHLANRVKPRWLSCRAVCRHCGTGSTKSSEIPYNGVSSGKCNTKRDVILQSFCQPVFDAALICFFCISHGGLLECS